MSRGRWASSAESKSKIAIASAYGRANGTESRPPDLLRHGPVSRSSRMSSTEGGSRAGTIIEGAPDFLVPVGDRQFLRREQRDHAAALVGDHDLFLDARGGIAVFGRAVGFEREHHAFLDLGRMIHRDHARDDRPLVDRATDAVAELQAERTHL